MQVWLLGRVTLGLNIRGSNKAFNKKKIRKKTNYFVMTALKYCRFLVLPFTVGLSVFCSNYQVQYQNFQYRNILEPEFSYLTILAFSVSVLTFLVPGCFSTAIIHYRHFQHQHSTSGGFRGGDGGGCIPPHQPKSNDFGQKISLYFE